MKHAEKPHLFVSLTRLDKKTLNLYYAATLSLIMR